MSSKNVLEESLGASVSSTGVFIPVRRGEGRGPALFNIDISAVTGTATLERSFDGGTTWVAVKAYTAVASEVGSEAEDDTQYRITTAGASSVTFHLGN